MPEPLTVERLLAALKALNHNDSYQLQLLAALEDAIETERKRLEDRDTEAYGL